MINCTDENNAFWKKCIDFDDDYDNRHKREQWWHESLLYNRWTPFGHNTPLSDSLHEGEEGDDDDDYDDK